MMALWGELRCPELNNRLFHFELGDPLEGCLPESRRVHGNLVLARALRARGASIERVHELTQASNKAHSGKL